MKLLRSADKVVTIADNGSVVISYEEMNKIHINIYNRSKTYTRKKIGR